MMKFIGDGKYIIPGIPPRDLTDEEVKQHGAEMLLKSGLYEKPKQPKKTKAVSNG